MARSGLVALAGVAVVALLAVACGGGDGAEPTPTVGRATPAPTQSATIGVALPTPITTPAVVAGITLYPPDTWWLQAGSGCEPRLGTDGSYKGPELYSIRQEELPDLGPAIDERSWAGVCKSGGITAIEYIFDDALVILTDGPPEWPAGVPGAEVPAHISAGEVAERPAVFLSVSQSWAYTVAVIVAEEFGLTIVFGKGTVEDARQIAQTIDRGRIQIPKGKDTFSGTSNGVRFYDYSHGENRKEGCTWDPFDRVRNASAYWVDIPPDTPLDIVPSYLPEGYSLYEKTAAACGGPIDFVEAYYNLTPRGESGFTVRRLSGEAAWFASYSEDWLTPGTIAGRPAVFIAPPAWASYMTYMWPEVVVKEDFGLTVVTGKISLDDAKRIAEGLNR
jgi:hypothetical protein